MEVRFVCRRCPASTSARIVKRLICTLPSCYCTVRFHYALCNYHRSRWETIREVTKQTQTTEVSIATSQVDEKNGTVCKTPIRRKYSFRSTESLDIECTVMVTSSEAKVIILFFLLLCALHLRLVAVKVLTVLSFRVAGFTDAEETHGYNVAAKDAHFNKCLQDRSAPNGCVVS